jgi:FkbM family methyltransferase
MQVQTFLAVDGDLKAEFEVRPGTHDPNIVQEIWDKHFYRAEGYEIKPGDYVVDIGAHIGSFTVWALKQGASVMAFEPDKTNYWMLMNNVNTAKSGDEPMGEADLHNVAVKGVGGIFFIDRGAEGQPNTGGYKIVEEMTGESVEVVQSMDAYDVLTKRTKIDFLKLDCEGSEYDILASVADTDILEKCVDKIVMEWHFNKEKAEKVVVLLESKGFTVTEFSTNPDAPEPLGRIMAKK